MQQSRVYTFDPLVDPRWPGFVLRHPYASVFHSRPWLGALQRTYGYEPVVFTTSALTEELRNAIVFCGVRSWLTGRRLVSLPFSDHCEPLTERVEDLAELLRYVQTVREEEGWKYVEVRPIESESAFQRGFQPADSFYLHRVSLVPSLDALLDSFHADSVQRKIRRAEREELQYEMGRSEALLQKMFRLLTHTRRRHRVPPQPIEWFRNLLACFEEDISIRIASKDGEPVASILTLRHGKTVVYKYGGSDEKYNPLGGMAFLFWKTIQEAKLAGALEFDLGRTDCDNQGLITFKERWAAERSTLTYWRSQSGQPAAGGWKMNLAKAVLARLPEVVLTRVGRMLYRHMG